MLRAAQGRFSILHFVNRVTQPRHFQAGEAERRRLSVCYVSMAQMNGYFLLVLMLADQLLVRPVRW